MNIFSLGKIAQETSSEPQVTRDPVFPGKIREISFQAEVILDISVPNTGDQNQELIAARSRLREIETMLRKSLGDEVFSVSLTHKQNPPGVLGMKEIPTG